MASHSVTTVKSATLSTTTVDTITITQTNLRYVEVLNRGTGAISFTYGHTATAGDVATPTALGDNCVVVPAGTAVMVSPVWPGTTTTSVIVKIIGSGDAYTVSGVA